MLFSLFFLTLHRVLELFSAPNLIWAQIQPPANIQKFYIFIVSTKDILPEISSEEVLGSTPKRKRTRIAKKDAVYTVSGMDGESLDTKEKRQSIKEQIDKAAQKGLFDEDFVSEGENIPENTTETVAKPTEELQDPALLFKPHRGRKSKAELEAIAAWEKQQKAKAEQEAAVAKEQIPTVEEVGSQNLVTEEAAEVVTEEKTGEDVVEETEVATETQVATEAEVAANEEISANSDEAANNSASNNDEIFASDTDFIVIQDIPTEDQALLQELGTLPEPIYEPIQTAERKPAVQKQAEYKEAKPAEHETAPKAEPVKQEKKEYNFDNIVSIRGVLEMMPDGYGFLRSSEYYYVSSPDDVYVAGQYVKQYGLKTGDVIECLVRPPFDGEKFFTLTSINYINGRKPEEVRDRIPFEHLTPLFPDEKFTLCGNPATTKRSTRIVDLFSPIGKGQRALIVAQPKTGKTILMKEIANAIAANHPEAYLMMLLIDERPEEVTDMARTVNAEVIASTFDEPAEKHVKIANLVLEKAKRLVECGHDVVIFLDSITRLARAYNTVAPASGKVLTGGVDANALQKPKRFFGAARNIENGGSLTIIATALIDTGSKMDEVIFEEFKGTGNMELQLDRALANKRIYPAVNLVASSTRRDDLLQDENTLGKMWIIRKHIADMNAIEAMTMIQQHMNRTRDNAEFFMSMNS